MVYRLSKPGPEIEGEITLDGSKSISNRLLIIRALCTEDFPIEGLSTSEDTRRMLELLSSEDGELDAGHAGTTFRFLTAYLAFREGEQVLTGSERMKQRPIGLLVDALRQLGARIEYLESEGFPPLRIAPPDAIHAQGRIALPADTSSQFISALLMMAPFFPEGLELTLTGTVVSRPYIQMTLDLMDLFGVRSTWRNDTIQVEGASYQPRPFRVEADWSAASYLYSMTALASEGEIQLNGLYRDSFQGDAAITRIMEALGVLTLFNERGVLLRKKPVRTRLFEWDFLECPDLAQTLAVACAAMGMPALFTGLETLRIKETDRIAALKKELEKVGVHFIELPRQFSRRSGKIFFSLDGKADLSQEPRFATYQDHRMAMAFAPLALLSPIQIEEPAVVVKSYPRFWEDLQKIGFEVEEI